jgi:preprotein translocase subunit YajC
MEDFMNLLFLTDGAAAAGNAGTTPGAGMSIVSMVIYLVIIGAVFYFLLIRPQKKQQKQMDALVSSLEIGDSVLTTAGFYGVVIDVMEEVIVVEFGNNKNCRIPMKKTAVVEVEKPEGATPAETKETKEKK